MGDGAILDANAFLMKGEPVLAGESGRGNPATRHADSAQSTAIPVRKAEPAGEPRPVTSS